MRRRTVLATTGLGLASLVAGCLQDDSSDGDDDPASTPSLSGDGARDVSLIGSPLEKRGLYGELTVELVDDVIEPDSPATIEATVRNTTDEPIHCRSGTPAPFGVVWLDPVDGDDERENAVTLWCDAYEDSTHVGTDGYDVREVQDIGVGEELAPDESIERTFELHAETSNLDSGEYVGEIGTTTEPVEGDAGAADLAVDVTLTVAGEEDDPDGDASQYVDEPPYEIEEPELPEDPDDADWNDHYLGEHMPEEPSVPFEVLQGVRLEDPWPAGDVGDPAYAVSLVRNEDERDAVFDLEASSSDARDRLEALAFEETVAVVVRSGFGSGSIEHGFGRVEADGGALYVHGYHTDPFVGTDDYTSWTSALVVEVEDAPELARLSVTVDVDRRVTVDSTDGVVELDE